MRAVLVVAALLLACSDDRAASVMANDQPRTNPEAAFARAIAREAADPGAWPIIHAAPAMLVDVANLRPVEGANATFKPGDHCFVSDGRLVRLIAYADGERLIFQVQESIVERLGRACPDGTIFQLVVPRATEDEP
jgi:hypothetical protein